MKSKPNGLTRPAVGCVCTTGDSRQMHYPDATFDTICTSPTYGNRMADHHEARATPAHATRTGTCSAGR